MRNEVNNQSPAATAICLDNEASCLPEHLTRLPGGDRWALWRCVGLRGAGFPTDLVLKLAAPLCSTAADQLLQAEDEVQQISRKALVELHALLKHGADGNLACIRKAIRRLRKNRLPETLPPNFAEADIVTELRCAFLNLDAARKSFEQAFETSRAEVSDAIREIARWDRFREAVIWQNRHALQTGIDALLRKADGSGAGRSKQQEHERLIANYLQRYCVKNETIGFFGPIGWARIVSEREHLIVNPGDSFIDSRKVYLEAWGIDALAQRLSENQTLRPWVAPRRNPFIHLEGTSLFLPSHTSSLSLQQAAVLHACDGIRTAKQIAARMMAVPSVGLRSEGEVYGILEILNEMGLISWRFEVPIQVYAERILRRQLEHIEDAQLRGSAIAALTELEFERSVVAQAAGNPDKLDQALAHLEEAFTRLTGGTAKRRNGKAYAGRTLVYEDCRRNVDVRIGQEMLTTLAPPLCLLLTSARWLTCEIAAHYQKIFKEVYSELSKEIGSPVVDCVSFSLRVEPYLSSAKAREKIIVQFQKHWAEILNLEPGQRRVEYSSRELEPQVRQRFHTPRVGWRAARYHSPDVTIEAPSLEAIRRGDYYLVLGELHFAVNTLAVALFMEECPWIDEVYRGLDVDEPTPRIIPIPPKSWSNVNTRCSVAPILAKDLRLEATQDSGGVPKAQALPIGSLVIEEREDKLVVRTRDGRRQFDIFEAFGELIANNSLGYFQILDRAPHQPRVTFDRLIVSREGWHLAPEELSFAWERDEAKRFLAVRRWMQACEMPRFVFVKVPVERKPFYVDFDSPIYVSMFAKMVRRSMENQTENQKENQIPGELISVTEMLPDINQAWLPDAAGSRYTSEFRFVVVDQAGSRA